MTPRLLLLGALLAAGPVRAQFYVKSSLIDDHRPVPGARSEGQVTLKNETDAPRLVRLYLTDYAFQADGSSRYGPPGSENQSAADWVTLGTSEMAVPARSEVAVRYAVDVPADAPDGTHWCVLMVEGEPVSPADGPAERRGLGIQRRTRFGVQIAVHLGDQAPDLYVSDIGVAEGDDRSDRQLWVEVGNGGAASADTQASVELFQVDKGDYVAVPGSRARLYPGTSFRHRVPLAGVAPGRYQALVIIDTGDEHAVASQLALDL